LVPLCSAATLDQLVCSNFSCSQTACVRVGTMGGCQYDSHQRVCTGNFSLDCQGLADRTVALGMGSDPGVACSVAVPYYGLGCQANFSNASFPACVGNYTPYAQCQDIAPAFCNTSALLMSGDRCYLNGTTCMNATSCSVLPNGTNCIDYVIGDRQCNQSTNGCVDGGQYACDQAVDQFACDLECADISPFGRHCRWDPIGYSCGRTYAPTRSPTSEPIRPPSPYFSGATRVDVSFVVVIVALPLLFSSK